MNLQRIRLGDIDWLLLLAVGGILALGGTYLKSASPDAFQTQLRWMALGIIAMSITLAIGYERLIFHAYTLYGIVLGLLVLVLFLRPHRGAHSWIDLPGFSIQPSELAKIAVVLVLARHLRHRENQSTLKGLMLPVLLVAVPVALILKQPDLGTAITLLPALFVVLFVSGARLLHLGGALAAGAAMALPMWLFIMKPYQKARIFAFLDPLKYEAKEAYQLIMSTMAIGSGGLYGAGWGEGNVNSLGLLPDRHTDFIFVVIAEEGGLVRAGILILFYAIMVLCGLAAATGTREPSGRIVAVGATAVLGGQAAINLMVVLGLLPTTGITLPLVSYGGSSMIASFVLIGLMLSVGISRPTVLHGETFTGGRE